jgi:hypothetical protein
MKKGGGIKRGDEEGGFVSPTIGMWVVIEKKKGRSGLRIYQKEDYL